MSAARRLALVEYAHRHGAWIVEDDYDSEFRHSGEPIPAMLGMVPDAPVVYLGTFSKTLFPALRIGFMVMPPALADAAQEAIGALLRGGTALNSGRWPALSRRGTMRVIWRRCVVCTANVSSCCARRWRKRSPCRAKSLVGKGAPSDAGHRGIDDRAIAQQARQFQLAPAALSHFYLDPRRGGAGWCWGMAILLLPAIRWRCGR